MITAEQIRQWETEVADLRDALALEKRMRIEDRKWAAELLRERVNGKWSTLETASAVFDLADKIEEGR
jgi:hypothetical protein